MRAIIVATILLLAINCSAWQTEEIERGHINQRGFFEYNDRKTLLEFLDYSESLHIDGNAYFYFDIANETSGKKQKVVLELDDEYTKSNIKTFESLKDGLIVKSDITALKRNIVNDSIYSKIEKLSEDEFYKLYVNSNGVLKSIGNWEIEKAIIYRILKSNIMIGQNDVSGEWSLGKEY